jgi:hypothetical protein
MHPKTISEIDSFSHALRDIEWSPKHTVCERILVIVIYAAEGVLHSYMNRLKECRNKLVGN